MCLFTKRETKALKGHDSQCHSRFVCPSQPGSFCLRTNEKSKHSETFRSLGQSRFMPAKFN